MYKLFYTQGNGYKCGCCRQEYNRDQDFNTIEEIIEWLSKMEASKEMPLYDNDDDITIDSIFEIKEDLTDKLKADPILTAKIIQERRDAKAKYAKEAKENEEASKIEHDKAILKNLAKKYPEVVKNLDIPSII